ncbi:MAG: PhoH family protein [Opitutaceae bacterium]|nr:PhoH family protein [Opitutaceae bacterium]
MVSISCQKSAKSFPGALGQAPVGCKTYILDTNVLLLDVRSIFNFEENNVALPAAVLDELDRIKGEQDSERGRNAREIHRLLLQLFPDERAIEEGVKLPGGGSLMIAIPGKLGGFLTERVRHVLGDLEKKDNQILLCALYIKHTYPPPTVLVTNDANVALKARAIGIAAEDYQTDNVDPKDVTQDHPCDIVNVRATELQSFNASGELQLAEKEFSLNQYVLLRTPEGHTMPARAVGVHQLAHLRHPDTIHPGTVGIRPRNLEQRFLCDALFDPAIKILTVRGHAGTGKTLLSIAAALSQAQGPEARYDRVLITRPVITVGKDIGYLPGSMEEKLRPYLQCYFDALEILYNSKKPVAPQFLDRKKSQRKERMGDASTDKTGNGGKPYERLIKSGVLQIEALQYIRGRSIPNSFILVDECQNLSRGEIRVLLTRAAENTRIVLIGDESQIDSPYLDAVSNGLVHVAVKMKGLPFAAHVNLTKGERSEVAEASARLL